MSNSVLINKGTYKLTSNPISNGLSYMNNMFCHHG